MATIKKKEQGYVSNCGGMQTIKPVKKIVVVKENKPKPKKQGK